MKIIKLIKKFKFSNDQSCIFLIRHAEKNIVTDITKDTEQLLTAQGKQSAKKLGTKLKVLYPKIFNNIKSSPMNRCRETATAILEAFSQTGKIKTLDTLNANGVYVKDVELIHKLFKNYQGQETKIFAEILSGKTMPGFEHKDQGTAILLESLLSDLDNLQGPAVYVTHDSILALFVGTLTQQIVDHNNWFGYLDGVCLKKTADGNGLFLYWNEQEFDITAKYKELMPSLQFCNSY